MVPHFTVFGENSIDGIRAIHLPLIWKFPVSYIGRFPSLLRVIIYVIYEKRVVHYLISGVNVNLFVFFLLQHF